MSLALVLQLMPAPSRAAPAFFAATHSNVRLVGRWAHGNGNGTCYADWSSSAIEFTATGPASVHIAEAYPHGNEYAVVINGSHAFELNTNSTKNVFPGASPDHQGNGAGAAMVFFQHKVLEAEQTASVRIEKLTESRTDAGGLMAFAGITAEALLPIGKPLSRRIECIGDSIMCGNHAKRKPHLSSTSCHLECNTTK